MFSEAAPQQMETPPRVSKDKKLLNLHEFSGHFDWKQEEKEEKLFREKIKSLSLKKLSEKMESGTFFQNENLICELALLAFKLENQMANYDMILSDEASGRLVSLFLRELIQRKRKEVGKGEVQTFFMLGGNQNLESKDKFIKKNKNKFGRTLIVTECIRLGEHVAALAHLLENNGIDFDIAALTTQYTYYGDKKIFYGEHSGLTYEEFYDRNDLSGVTKVVDGSKPKVHPVSYKKERGNSSQERERIQQSVNSVRRDIKFLAKEISKLLEPVKE